MMPTAVDMLLVITLGVLLVTLSEIRTRRRNFNRLNRKLEHIMSIEDDLGLAVANLGNNLQILVANIAANDVAIQAELGVLAAAVAAAQPTNSSAAIQVSIDAIGRLSSTAAAAAAAVASETETLTKSVPAPTPPPPPVVAPEPAVDPTPTP